MKKKNRKLVAPVIITVIMVLILLAYFLICLIVPIPLPFKLIGILGVLSLVGVSIFVLAERVKEVRSGEEDDLSQY